MMKKTAKSSFTAPLTGKNANTGPKQSSERKSLTDKEYNDLFDGVLRRSLIKDAIDSDQPASQSQKKYATLQPVEGDRELNAVLDSVLEMNCSPPQKVQCMQTNSTTVPSLGVSTQKPQQQPIWKSSKTISEVKSESRSNVAAKKKKDASSKPSYSVQDLCKKKDKTKNRLSKSEKGVKIASKRARNNSDDLVDEPWTLTQECSKGVWIQCGNDDCCKWRHLNYMHDPSKFISVKWTCADNEDESHNTCDAPVEHWDESADWTYNKYTEGSLVWARVDGYPWWPAMVEVDPDMNAFVFCFEHSRYTPVEYHVTFFDKEKATRAWLTPNNIKPFVTSQIKKELPSKGLTDRLTESVRQAEECSSLSLVQRLRMYGFTVRYDGQIVGVKSKPPKPPQQTIHGAKASKAPRSVSENKPGRKPRSQKRKVTPTTAKAVASGDISLTGNKESAAPTVGMNEAVWDALLPVLENSHIVPSSQPAVTSSQPAVTSQALSQPVSRGDSMQHVDLEKELDEIESILSQSLMSQRSISLSPAPQRNRPISPASTRENSQSNRFYDSQSGSSQSQQILQTSSNQSKSQAGCSQSKSQAGGSQSKSQAGGSQSKSQACSQSKSRSVSPAVPGNATRKTNKKGFKCPALNVERKKDEAVSHPATAVDGLKIANSSVFTQELSGAANTQKSATSQQGLRLSNSSVFTQELSGKDPFTRASNVDSEPIKTSSRDGEQGGSAGKDITDPVALTDDIPTAQSSGRLNLEDNSIFTQELSARNPFAKASSLNCAPVGLDNSIFTQELSNKVKKSGRAKGRSAQGDKRGKKKDDEDFGSYSEYSSTDSEQEEPASQDKLADVHSPTIPREC